MSSTESRLAAVERQLRSHRAVIAALLVALVALIGYGATKGVPDEIRAREFVVVNKEGREVVKIDSWVLGGRIATYPAHGENWASVSISHTDNGHGLLTVSNKEGKDLIYAGAGITGDGLLEVSNKAGKDLFRVGANQTGDGLLTVKNKAGKKFIAAAAGPDGGLISIYNKTGESVVAIKADEYGMGYVGAFDRQGKGRTLTPR